MSRRDMIPKQYIRDQDQDQDSEHTVSKRDSVSRLPITVDRQQSE